MRSRSGAIANPHGKIFDPTAHQDPPLVHSPGDRMKIPFDTFYIYICENTHKALYKNLCN